MKRVGCKELKDTAWGKFLAVFLALVFALSPFNAAAIAETFNPENKDQKIGVVEEESENEGSGAEGTELNLQSNEIQPTSMVSSEEKTPIAEESVTPSIPAEVQAFLDAVAAIPEITPENATEVAEYVYGPVSEAYEALLGTEYEERADVLEATEAYAAAISAIDFALNMESISYSPASLSGITIKNYIGYHEKLDDLYGGATTKWVGDSLPYNYCPTDPAYCGYCGNVLVELIPEYYAFPDLYHAEDYNASDDGIIEYQGYEKAWYPLNTSYAGLRFNYSAKKPGTVTAELIIAHGYKPFCATGYCNNGHCQAYVQVYNDSYYYSVDPYWYQRYISFDVTVNARYQLDYDLDGGTGSISPTVKDETSTSATLDITSTIPTKTGYTFKGWQDENGNPINGSSITLNWSEGYGSKDNPVQKTLTAVWEKAQQQYTFTVIHHEKFSSDTDAASVTNMPDPYWQSKKSTNKTETLTLPSTVPQREGYTFGGWQWGVGGPTYQAGGTITLTVPEDQTSNTAELYAIWQKNLKKHSVVYSWSGLPDGHNETLPTGGNYAEGTEVDVDTAYFQGKEVTVGDTTYVFSGWNTTNATISNNKFTMPGNDVIIRGTWSVKVPEKPNKPTGNDLKNIKLGVEIQCDEASGHAATLYSLGKIDDLRTIGEVIANTGANRDQYPYTCTVSISTTQQNEWLKQGMQGGTPKWNADHKLLDNATTLTKTLYWDGSSWTDLDTTDNWHYMIIHTMHKPKLTKLEKERLTAAPAGIAVPEGINYDHGNGKIGGTTVL